MTIKEYFGDWMRVIDEGELKSILYRLNSEYSIKNISPSQDAVFKAFKLCPYNDLKVVMLGQDPYPQKDIATGILFGNDKKVTENNLSPSLQVIKEAVINYEIPHSIISFDQTLESWSKQGILMLNSALTVEVNKVGSHVMLWRPFIAKLLKNLSEREPGIIYVLFGRQAQTFRPYINKQFSTVLEESHPAYFARINGRMPGTIFKQINKLVKERYNIPIEWYIKY